MPRSRASATSCIRPWKRWSTSSSSSCAPGYCSTSRCRRCWLFSTSRSPSLPSFPSSVFSFLPLLSSMTVPVLRWLPLSYWNCLCVRFWLWVLFPSLKCVCVSGKHRLLKVFPVLQRSCRVYTKGSEVLFSVSFYGKKSQKNKTKGNTKSQNQVSLSYLGRLGGFLRLLPSTRIMFYCSRDLQTNCHMDGHSAHLA